MDKQLPLISVIMPVYQTSAYLEEAVRSVQAQTWENWELLLIDDGSTDGSAELCDALARKDRRIRVFHQANGGVSRARNRGLEEARGSYYSFTDSDDALDPDFLSWLLEKQKTVPDGAACCGISEFGKEAAAALPAENAGALADPEDFILEALMGRLPLPLCCANWLIPARLAEGLRFDPDLRYSEDSLFLCEVLARCGHISCELRPLYRYRSSREGNTATLDTYQKNAEKIPAWEKILALYRNRSGKASQAVLRHLTELSAQASRRASQEGLPKAARAYRENAMECWKQLDKNGPVPAGDRRRLLFYALCPVLSEKVMLKVYGRV
ncbi:MAG: glycosyltransferase family 2 protein [Lachnospiraceae bacterium]|nr:glycosyltransferase family 2 protein [Lachnospiraceae bacterium]